MSLTRRSMVLGLTGLATGLAYPAHAQTRAIGGRAFGSFWRVTTDARFEIERLSKKCEVILDRIDARMSPYRETSALSRFNVVDDLTWQTMPAELCHVTSEALRIGRMTQGAFDITVGPTVSRFGFGPIKGRKGSFDGIEVAETALRKSQPRLTLDLCGIAKGHALDQIAEALVAEGIENAMIEVGGEVKGIGPHPDGRPWQIALSDPHSTQVEAYAIITPHSLTLATSGHAANGITGPINSSHIIDPQRDRPASPKLSSVSVLASTGTEADALATALCAMGPTRGVAFARKMDIAAFFIFSNKAGRADVMTGRFSEHVLI